MTKHGMAGEAGYQAWLDIKKRCYNPADPAYPNYGGRGIEVCERWLNDARAFFADMGPRPPGAELDRIDNDRGYYPDNCRWTTHTVNCRNTRRVRIVEFEGQRRCLSEWGEITGLGDNTLYCRLFRCGWPVSRALTTPSRKCLNPRSVIAAT